jgi:hypothetical protein
MKAVLIEHDRKLVKQRERLAKTHTFERDRFNSTLKAMDWRAKRFFQDQRDEFSRTTAFNQRDIDHAKVMEMHKVKSNVKNADPPSHRRVNPKTNTSCRGSRQLETVAGKRYLAIPGIAMNHDFRNNDFPILSQISTKNRFKTIGKQDNQAAGGSNTARF